MLAEINLEGKCSYMLFPHLSIFELKNLKLNELIEAHCLGSRFNAKLFRTVVENVLADQDIDMLLDFSDAES